MKASLLKIHRLLSLSAAIFLLVQALSGLALVFAPQFAQILDPVGMISRPGSRDVTPDRLLATAEARYPGYHVSQLVFPVTSDSSYIVQMLDAKGIQRFVSLDRHTGEVRREGSIWRFPVVAAVSIHDQWLVGRFGTIGITFTGLSLLIIAGTGIAYWWPGRSRFRKSLEVKWHLSPRIVIRQLHRTTGVAVSFFLAFMAITGLLIEAPRTLAPAPTNWTTKEKFSRHIVRALELAAQRFPNRSVENVYMLAPKTVAVFFRAPERNAIASHRVLVDIDSDRVLSVRNAFDVKEAWMVALPLHSGRALGTAGQLLVFIIGLSLTILALTGPLIWLQGRYSRRRKGVG